VTNNRLSTAIEEVVRQHVFIEAWLNGSELPGLGMADFDASLGLEFVMVPPSGTRTSKSELLESFGAARGLRPGLTIEIRNAELAFVSDTIHVVRYEEWHLHSDLGNQLISTAVLEHSDASRREWTWRALHETALVI
jgi:hypothetical protein